MDSVLNIVLPAKRKLQTDRPTTAKTPDTTTLVTTSATGHVSYWKKNGGPDESTLSVATQKATTTQAPVTSEAPLDAFLPAARFTRKPTIKREEILATTSGNRVSLIPLEGFLAGSALIDGVYSDVTAAAFTVAVTTATTRKPTTVPGTTVAATSSTTITTPSTSVTTVSTTTTTTTTTPSTTTPSTTLRSTVRTTVTTPLTTQTATNTKSSTTPATTKALLPVVTATSSNSDPDDTVLIDNTADGVIKVQLNGDTSRRFGGVVRVPAHSIIGGGMLNILTDGYFSVLFMGPSTLTSAA